MYPNDEFATMLVIPPNMLIPVKITGNPVKIAIFSQYAFLTFFEYEYSPNGNITAVHL